jgi:hypothetical protein
MKLHIQTQIQENYGAHDWDGEGTCPQHWKFKGGNDYMVPVDTVKAGEFFDKKCEMIVDSVRGQIEENSDYYRENILGWTLVADDFLTEFEQSQLEYDGAIVYPARVLEPAVA